MLEPRRSGVHSVTPVVYFRGQPEKCALLSPTRLWPETESSCSLEFCGP
jgi:hypothetical protein